MKQLYPGNHDNLSGGGAAVRADTHPQMESIYIYTHLTTEASVHVTWLLLPDWSSALCWSGAAKRGDLSTPRAPDLLPLGTTSASGVA